MDSFSRRTLHDFSHLIACFINNTKSTSCMNFQHQHPHPYSLTHPHTHSRRTPCVCGPHPLCCMTQIARREAVGQFEYLTLHARACPAYNPLNLHKRAELHHTTDTHTHTQSTVCVSAINLYLYVHVYVFLAGFRRRG